ncbi:lytic transglycosylase domain-containing protein [bacterium]|nr:lytic transglycosylase domain-containing protein [bacterium]
MNRTKWTILLISIGALFILALNSSQYTEEAIQVQKLNERYQIYPVPIPSDLKFSGEKVPLNSFNVKERLDRELLVNTYWQSNTMLILKRSKKAFEVIEPILKANGIPEDFKYLAVAESGLQQLVTSSAGAKGLWQFIERSGKYYGLNINSNIDERYHLEKSTQAACKYLKEAYAEFGNWTLAAASYNRGITGIRNALEDQSVDSYYDLHLNSETSRYILRVLAFKAIIESPQNYGFYLESKDYYRNESTRTVKITEPIENLAEYAKTQNCTYHELRTLNPWILGKTISSVGEDGLELRLPLKP